MTDVSVRTGRFLLHYRRLSVQIRDFNHAPKQPKKFSPDGVLESSGGTSRENPLFLELLNQRQALAFTIANELSGVRSWPGLPSCESFAAPEPSP